MGEIEQDLIEPIPQVEIPSEPIYQYEDLVSTEEDYIEIDVAMDFEREFRFSRNGVIGTRESIEVGLSNELEDHLASLPRYIEYYPDIEDEPNDADFLRLMLEEPNQLREIKKIADEIRTYSNDTQEQARIAITMVQMIPYDNYAFENLEYHTERYPYQVLTDYKGICGEKSTLIIMLLRELGFGTAQILFNEEAHAVAGIQCPEEYSFRKSGYCFVESNEIQMIGQSDGRYVDVGRLLSTPVIIPVSEGETYTDISDIYETALEEVETGERTIMKDKYNNKFIRVQGGFWDQYNDPDLYLEYGDNSFILMEY